MKVKLNDKITIEQLKDAVSVISVLIGHNEMITIVYEMRDSKAKMTFGLYIRVYNKWELCVKRKFIVNDFNSILTDVNEDIEFCKTKPGSVVMLK